MYGITTATFYRNLKFLMFFALNVFFIQRLAIFAWSLPDISVSWQQTLGAFALGSLFDLSFLIYTLIPYVFLFVLYPRYNKKNWGEKIFWVFLDLFNFIFIFVILYTALSEMFFWNEFKARYNFIAVDYLVYTTEVLKNILESYPTWKILTGLVIADVFVLLQINSRLEIQSTQKNILSKKFKFLMAAISIGILNFGVMNQSYSHVFKDIAYQEISKNGGYSLFYSYFENQINYDQFYLKMPVQQAVQKVRDLLKSPHTAKSEKDLSLQRSIFYPRVNRPPLNVVVVLMESMGARFLGAFGSQEHLTPSLDFLAKQGLFFNNIYATGTRTVRGIEAVTLSVPPTPGQSIVRRPDNEKLVTLNSYFAQAGYDTQFIYGGYSYFDNMQYYLKNNNMNILDIADVPQKDIQFSNAWGMSDEDIFELALENADKHYLADQPFYQLILTTSNHRPFTYPPGRIDIPSGTGRAGAVKYADYAIGEFVNKARDKKWFDNTIFVFVADHDAGVAGNAEVQKKDYLIPVVFFAPKWIRPQTISKLGSQIDVGPTLLGLLNMSHESFGFGEDLLKNSPDRAFISNYQKIGLLKNDFLTLIEPVRKYVQYEIHQDQYKSTPFREDELQETIAYYQAASFLFKNHKLKSEHEKLILNR